MIDINPKSVNSKIILGIDPGTSIMGYGLIVVEGSNMRILQYGVIHLNKYQNQEIKLKKIHEKMLQIINEFAPDEVALESPFYGKNVQSMLKLGRAQGVAMAAALSCQIPIVEYAPRKIKQSVTGNGNASKEQVSRMLQSLLNFEHADKLMDATDALAVAVCHYFQGHVPGKKFKSWESFAKDNPDRVK